MLGRLQIYGLIGLSFMLGCIGIYSAGMSKGQDKVKRKLDEKRLYNMKLAKEVDDEVNEMGDTYLADRASRWLRDDKDEW